MGTRWKAVPQCKDHLTGAITFQEIHCDGHEKLCSKVLQLGNDIYGMRCHSGGLIVAEQVVPNLRCDYIIAHCYLDMVEEFEDR